MIYLIDSLIYPLFKCKRTPDIAKNDGTYAKFCEIVKREGITRYAEYGEETVSAFHSTVENAK